MKRNYPSLIAGKSPAQHPHKIILKSICTFLMLLLSTIAFSQVTVTSTAGTGAPSTGYATLAAAITAINGGTAHTGTITCTVNGGYAETTPAGGFTITATGTVLNPITFQTNGIGASPVFRAPNPQVSGNLNDGIFKIIGGDYITLNGFTLIENPANANTTAASNNMTEWGVALLYASATNGAQHCTIKNCSIGLNRNYQNTFGIYSNSTHTATAIASSASATGANGGNSGLTITGNSIADVNQGILVVGPTASGDENDGLVIGGAGANGNSITNFGKTSSFSSYANVSGTVFGILVRNTKNYSVTNNIITSPAGNVTVGALRGIYNIAASNAPTGVISNAINNNSISLTSAVSGAISGIEVASGSSNATTTLTINNNDFHDCGYTLSATTAFAAIQNLSSGASATISNNTFTNLSISTSNIAYLINNNNTTPDFTVNNNAIVGTFAKTVANNIVYGYFNFGTSTPSGTANVTNNNFSNITVTGPTQVYGIRQYSSVNQVENVTGNTISNITGGTGTILGISHGYGAPGSLVGNNNINTITSSGTIYGIRLGDLVAGNVDATGNIVRGLHTTGTSSVINGFYVTAGITVGIHKNKIYDLESADAGGSVNGIFALPSGGAVSISNNLIGDLRTPNANAANPLIGINVTFGASAAIYYNTVYLNGTSTGTDFGSSSINFGTNVSNITLRNNILINNSTPNGTGLAVAHRRASTALTTYATASNNNIFYGSNIFTDGTNTDASIAAYKSRVTPRETASLSENTAFVSTSGASANFLHINPAVATGAESGAVTIATYTTDYDGDTRAATPDIGADEGTFTLAGTQTPCTLTTIWNGTSWAPFAPSANQNAEIAGNYSSAADLAICSLNVTSGNVTINSGHDLTITNGLTVAPTATLTLENNANLIQTNSTANSGNITAKRNTTMRRLDYTYWGSPVAGQDLKLFSPQTVSPPVGASRFYTMDETTNSFTVIANPSGVNFALAKGYMLRAPNDFPVNGAVTPFVGQFTGVPNNGNAVIAITNTPGTGQGFNMLGNPYASPVDANLFLAANPGALYFWTHFSQAAASGANYATYTTFGTAAAAGGATPNGFIQTGQGFLLKTATSGNATFTNAMRTGNNAGQFFRGSNEGGKNRIWLNLSAENKLQNQILIGYMDGATNGFDAAVDARQIESGISNIAVVMNNENYNILANAMPFALTDTFPLSFKALNAGAYTISAAQTDGLFTGENVMLADNLTGTVHDLKSEGYTFASEAGTFTNRFSVVFQNTTLGTENPVLNANSIVVYKENNTLQVNSGSEIVTGIKVFDISGRLLFEQSGINANHVALENLKAVQQVLLVQIITADNKLVTKKVIY